MATVDIGTPLLERIKAFRLGKHSQSNAALIIKVNKAKLDMDVEDELRDISLDELKEGASCFASGEGELLGMKTIIKGQKVAWRACHAELAETNLRRTIHAELPENSPRYIILSYELRHKDGRVSFPLVLIYWAPQTSSMELSTLYTRCVNSGASGQVRKRVVIRANSNPPPSVHISL